MIHGFITGQALKIQQPLIVADTIDYLECKFVFHTSDWKGLTKWAHFRQGKTVYDIKLIDDKITKDKHLNLSKGEWSVYLHGNELVDGKVVERITTDSVKLTVQPCGTLDGEPFPDAPATPIEQLEARVEKLEKNGTGGGGGSGIDGENGATFYPYVSADGVISWTNDKNLKNPEAVNIKGEKGDKGDAYTLTDSDKSEIAGIVENNIDIPTKTSQLENNSGFVTEKAVEPLSDVQYLNGNLFDPNNIVHGEKYNTTTGVAETSTATVRTKELILLDKTKEYNFIFYFSDHSLLPSTDVYGYVLTYDENRNFIQSYPFNTVKPNGKTLKVCHITGASYVGFHIVHFNTYYPTESPKVMIYEGITDEDWENVEYIEYGVGYGKYKLPRLVVDIEKSLPHFCNKFLKISYSNFDSFAPINTMETYLTACKLGFDAVKGDIRLTSDDGLIMCHDAGLTYDDNGYLKSYDKDNARVIREMTLEECLNSYHAINNKMLGHLGHRTHMTTFEEYIKICRENDKVAFVTVRDEYMDIIAPLVLALLEKYNMVENSIINSFTLESLRTFRNLNDKVMLSNVLDSGVALTQSHIDTAVELGNCLISLLPFPNNDAWETTMENSKAAMEYAKQRSVLVYGAIANRYVDYIKSVHYGLSGLQLSTVVMPYEPKRYLFKVTLSEGVATFADEFIAEKYTANVTQAENKISISDIRANESGRDFDDALMQLWLNRLPYNMSITEESGKNCDISFSGSSIDINTNGETSAIYHFSVTV